MATMYDSTEPAAIPADAAIVAGYVDGLYAWGPDQWARFQHATKVTIAIEPTTLADVLDVEDGNPVPPENPARALEWAALIRTHGIDPTIYVDLNGLSKVVAAFTAAGANQPHYWVADWTGVAHMVPGSAATQWANPPASGGHYDLSETAATWPPVPAAPVPAPPPAPVPPAPVPAPTPPTGGFVPPTVNPGEISGTVRNVQRLVNVHNGGLVVDGIYGPKSEQAVRNFQTIMRLGVDGIVGPQTWSALDAFG